MTLSERRRYRAVEPIIPKLTSIIAHVAGSGATGVGTNDVTEDAAASGLPATAASMPEKPTRARLTWYHGCDGSVEVGIADMSEWQNLERGKGNSDVEI